MTLFLNRPAAWIKSQLARLSETDTGLVNVFDRAPFVVFRQQKNFFTAPCTALIFIRAGAGPEQKVRIFFLPNFFTWVFIVCWLLSLLYSLNAHYLSINAHDLDPRYAVLPVPVGIYVALAVVFLLLLGSVRKEKAYLGEQLWNILSRAE